MKEFFDDIVYVLGLVLMLKPFANLLRKDIPAIARKAWRRRNIVVNVKPVVMCLRAISATASVSPALPAHLSATSGITAPVWFEGIGDKT